jgi:Protein of unknown function (DUF3828)
MLIRSSILFVAACAIAASVTASRSATAGPAAADDASARAFVSAIYDSFTGGRQGVRIDSGPKLRRYFEPALAQAMNKDQENAAKHHEVGELDGDPFIDAQDWEIKQFVVGIEDTAPGKVRATVNFINFDKQKTIVLELVAIKNDWRIFDIIWSRDGKPESLRALFGLQRQGGQRPANEAAVSAKWQAGTRWTSVASVQSLADDKRRLDHRHRHDDLRRRCLPSRLSGQFSAPNRFGALE